MGKVVAPARAKSRTETRAREKSRDKGWKDVREHKAHEVGAARRV